MRSISFVAGLLLFQITGSICKPGNFNIFGAIHHNQNLHWNVNFHDRVNKDPKVDSHTVEQLIFHNKTIHNSSEKNTSDDLSAVIIVSYSSQAPGPYSKPECADCSKINEDNYIFNQFEYQRIQFGWEIDQSFNDTRDENDPPNKLISSPGCPFSSPIWGMISHPMNQHIWVHYGTPQKCFLVGTQGPCPDGSKLAAQRNSPQGICRCACDFKSFPSPYLQKGEPIEEVYDPFLDTVGPYCFDGRAHHAMYQNKCYKILTQGPCDSSEAFVVDLNSNTPTCKERECFTNTTYSPNEISSFTFYFNGTCQKMGSRCFNSSDPTRYYFWDVRQNSPSPSCLIYKNPGLERSAPSQILEFPAKSCAKKYLTYSDHLQTCVFRTRSGRTDLVG